MARGDLKKVLKKKRLNYNDFTEALIKKGLPKPSKALMSHWNFWKCNPRRRDVAITALAELVNLSEDQVEKCFKPKPQPSKAKLYLKKKFAKRFKDKSYDLSEWKEVGRYNWYPTHAPKDYPGEFVAWIDSINADFRERIQYLPFELYKKQAELWMEDKSDILDFVAQKDQELWLQEERRRCEENSLYGTNRYLWLKEGNKKSGKVKFKAFEAQEILLFLYDCKYCLFIGKGRQIGFTSAIMGAAALEINVKKSLYIKFLTKSEEKGIEILTDKAKYAFGSLPKHFKNTVSNDARKILALADPTEKGSNEGMNSRIEVNAPNKDAINGGSPDRVLLDEADFIPGLTEMVNEGKPVLYWNNPETKRPELRRQLIAWTTGGSTSSDGGGSEFEGLYRACLEAWEKRNFEYGVIPLFFNAYAKPGVTDELLLRWKEEYYSVQGLKAAVSKIQYSQHYPQNIDDMFLRSANTIIPIMEINQHLNRINSLRKKPQYGYFEPIYDTSIVLHEGDLPHPVINSVWVPTKGIEDSRTAAVIVSHPEKDWKHRYWQGTDPINSETGLSNFSSSVWDKELQEPVCVINFRVRGYKECYLQSLLAGLYYGQEKKPIPHLIESNIGDGLYDYIDTKGYEHSLMYNSELLESVQGASAKLWGISNKTNTAHRIIRQLMDLCDRFRNNIRVEWFFRQLKHFIEKELRTAKDSNMKQTRYQSENLVLYHDDVIFAINYSYIASLSSDYAPKFMGEVEGERRKGKRVIEYGAHTNWQKRIFEEFTDANGEKTRVPIGAGPRNKRGVRF